jgi:hypothetical protein
MMVKAPYSPMNRKKAYHAIYPETSDRYIDVALVQLLVPTIKAEYGPDTGDLLMRDLGD